jgi:hypothetical protein
MKIVSEDIRLDFQEVSAKINELSSYLNHLTTDTAIYLRHTEEEVTDMIDTETARIILHAKQMKYLIRQARKTKN